MITLYQLHWSHYVEKVRWALDYKRVEWSAVDVDPFSKRQMRHLQCMTALQSGGQLYTVPTIEDRSTGSAVGQSSDILDYLEQTYPAPMLYPANATDRAEARRWMVWLDSTLGLAARRLAYTQIALEHPGFLAELFLPRLVSPGAAGSFKGRLVGSIVSGVLTRRFRFLHNRADRVFEQLEQCLLLAAQRLRARQYLVGDQFTAADLTLASLLRPITVVPFFREHPQLQGLFDWRAKQLREHGRDLQCGYETTLHDVRRRRGWALGEVSWLPQRSDHTTLTEPPADPIAYNDQQSVGRWPRATGLATYWRLLLTAGLGRTRYA